MAGSLSRPSTALVAPTLLARAYEDPGLVLDLIERGAPYKTLAAVHKDPASDPARPWFRNFWALGGKVLFPGAEEVFNNPLFIEAAREVFEAEVISPLAMMTNLNAPSPAGPPHLDLPFFRGAHRREVPSWLLAPMGYSGLFHQWAIPVASVISWFYGGDGGEFELWEHGLDEPSVRVGDLDGNRALMADNEYTYHRVCQVGSESEFVANNEVPYDALLNMDGDDWVIGHNGDEIARYPRTKMRISVLWKAFCFTDQAAADAFTSNADNLSPGQIIDAFRDDLRRRGVKVDRPDSLAAETPWARAVRKNYAGPGQY